MRLALSLAFAALVAGPAAAQTRPLGANLEAFAYDFPVRWFETQSQGGPVRMAYLDVPPSAAPNGRTLVLLHGKNFCAGTWVETIRGMTARGYRVIAPDQVGFCKSSKPAGYQYSFHTLATLTRGLLDQAGVKQAVLVGHSTGGILGVRFGLLFPDRVQALVLVNPLGLNDTLAEGATYADLGELRAGEARTTAETIKAYQLSTYYNGRWKPDYDRWVEMLAGQYASPDGDVVRDAQARLSDMIQTQPVAAELDRLAMPVTLIIGMRDKTAFRANSAPPALRPNVKAVPAAAEAAVGRFKAGRLVRLPELGHSPQVEAPELFNETLAGVLRSAPGESPGARPRR